jgi:hypothetical protein
MATQNGNILALLMEKMHNVLGGTVKWLAAAASL